jgi:signal transduction histidine kinase
VQKDQAVAVMETQEQERKRIAEDLHDSLGHLLSTAKLNLQTFPDSQRHLMESPLELLNQASTEIRNITFNLMPKTLEEEGLIPALKELTAKVSNACPVKVMLHVHGMENVSLEKQVQFNIYRIIQEAVNNILKHASATEVSIQLLHQDKSLTIMIEDDGKGFDTKLVKKESRGITNITTRAQWLNGAAAFDSQPGRGTTLSIEIPL